MWSYMKAIWTGVLAGLRWYERRFRESKWWIIAFAIDIILIPVKVPMVIVAGLSKCGRRWLINTFGELIEDED